MPNEFVRGVGDVVERLKRTAVGQGGIAENADDILVAPLLVTGGGHAQRGGQGSAGVACAVAVVLTFRAQRKPFRPSVVRMVRKRSLRPVNSLCT